MYYDYKNELLYDFTFVLSSCGVYWKVKSIVQNKFIVCFVF